MTEDLKDVINQTPSASQKAQAIVGTVASKVKLDQIKLPHAKLLVGLALGLVFLLTILAIMLSAKPKNKTEVKLPEAPLVLSLPSPSPALSPLAQKVADFNKKIDAPTFQKSLPKPIVDLDISFIK